MCIYCGTKKYRRIYENHFGLIPKDIDGRSYEIHHIDGNPKNNDPSNLVALTIQEHYDIHYTQGDWAACLLISDRMNILPVEKSNLATLNNLKQIENGTHPFLGGKLQREMKLKQVEAGTHPWQKRSDGTSLSSDLVIDGKHHLLKRSDGSSHAADRVKSGHTIF